MVRRPPTDLEVARALAYNESLREPEPAELSTDDVLALFDDESQPTTNILPFPAAQMPTHRTVRLLRLDGTVFASAGFPVTGRPDPGAPWAWIQETVAHELSVREDSVGCLEPDNDEDGGGDYVTVDGLPVYRVQIC